MAIDSEFYSLEYLNQIKKYNKMGFRCLDIHDLRNPELAKYFEEVGSNTILLLKNKQNILSVISLNQINGDILILKE